MATKSTQNALRIKINGPELPKPDIFAYAQAWTLKHWYTDNIIGMNKQEEKKKNKGFSNENLEEMSMEGITYSQSRLY